MGSQELEEFRMIERHYFRDQLVKSFDFTFGCVWAATAHGVADMSAGVRFVIPNSTNTWDAVYSLPPLDDDLSE